MKLNSKNVSAVFAECLVRGHDADYIKIEGVKMGAAFNTQRLEQKKAEIVEMLECLPNEFRITGGGGWTFLNMCLDNEGNQWCDLHATMDELVCLGIGIGKLNFQLPRDMWSSLQGGMPFLVYKDIEINPPKATATIEKMVDGKTKIQWENEISIMEIDMMKMLDSLDSHPDDYLIEEKILSLFKGLRMKLNRDFEVFKN
jgi:hypothetical protein